jgi:phosphoglycerate dehydrogenase-like enzyme
VSEHRRILLHYDRPELLRDLIAARFPQVELRCCSSYGELAGALADFAPQVLFCVKFEDQPYPRDAIMACPSIEWVSNGGAGMDHLLPWNPNRLTVTNASGVASRMMAEYVIGGMLALSIGLPNFIRRQMQHRWQFERVAGIAGKTVAIVGLGRTGRAVAGLASALDMRVIGTRAHPTATPNVDRVYPATQLHEALGEGDFVVVTAPLLGSTRHLIGRRRLPMACKATNWAARYWTSSNASPWPPTVPCGICTTSSSRPIAPASTKDGSGGPHRCSVTTWNAGSPANP